MLVLANVSGDDDADILGRGNMQLPKYGHGVDTAFCCGLLAGDGKIESCKRWSRGTAPDCHSRGLWFNPTYRRLET